MTNPSDDITRLLSDVDSGREGAMDELNGGETTIPVVEFTPPSR